MSRCATPAWLLQGQLGCLTRLTWPTSSSISVVFTGNSLCIMVHLLIAATQCRGLAQTRCASVIAV